MEGKKAIFDKETLIPVSILFAAVAGACTLAWFGGVYNQRLTTVEETQKTIIAEIKTMPTRSEFIDLKLFMTDSFKEVKASVDKLSSLLQNQ